MSNKNDLEIFDDYNKKNYNIYVAKNENKMNFMTKYFDYFTKLNKTKYIGIDLEFNKVSKNNRDVALIQLNLEISNSDIHNIFVLDPRILNKTQTNQLILLLTAPDITKIIHGGESLDIPYLFNQLFNSDELTIKKFTKNLYDTKYLCEYYHLIKNIKAKCSIYDLYKEYNVVTESKYKYLSNIENITGPIYLVHIDINKMSSKVLEYAVYDVLYLITLINKIRNKIKNKTIETLQNITSNVFFYKRIDNDNYNKLYELVTKFNNYYIINNKENVKLLDIYYYVIYSLNNPIYLNLLEITYFKAFIDLIFKYLVYSEISNKYTVYKNKNVKTKIILKLEYKIIFGDEFINILDSFKLNISKLL